MALNRSTVIPGVKSTYLCGLPAINEQGYGFGLFLCSGTLTICLHGPSRSRVRWHCTWETVTEAEGNVVGYQLPTTAPRSPGSTGMECSPEGSFLLMGSPAM